MAAVAAVSLPVFSGLKAQVSSQKTVSFKAASCPVMAAPVASLKNEVVEKASKAMVAAAAAFCLMAPGALAAVEIKMGADDGALAFVPKKVVVVPGEKIVFINNSGFPHNVLFDEDEIPTDADGEPIKVPNHEESFNARGETYEISLEVPGKYEYYCEPHQGTGMKGEIIVK